MHPVPLVCPRDHSLLQRASPGSLTCEHGHRYPVVDGVPVLLRDDVDQTMALASASMARATHQSGAVDLRDPDLFLESLGISEAEKELAVEIARTGRNDIDPVVSVIVGATSGHSYRHLVGRLATYPIPDLRLPSADGKTLLDIGCNWGRWSVAAARKGYRVIGIDPSLGAIMAARRVARQLGVDIDYVVADARYLPFDHRTLDTAFSYSVLQHFAKSDALRAVSEIARVLKPSGHCLIQMAHTFGCRSLYHQMRRGFREGSRFEVRYWTIPQLRRALQEYFERSAISVHCYFGLGLETSNVNLMPRHLAWLISLSEGLRTLSARWPLLTYLADSLYVSAGRPRATDGKGHGSDADVEGATAGHPGGSC